MTKFAILCTAHVARGQPIPIIPSAAKTFSVMRARVIVMIIVSAMALLCVALGTVLLEFLKWTVVPSPATMILSV